MPFKGLEVIPHGNSHIILMVNHSADIQCLGWDGQEGVMLDKLKTNSQWGLLYRGDPDVKTAGEFISPERWEGPVSRIA